MRRCHNIFTGPNGEQVIIDEKDYGSGDIDYVVHIINADGTEKFNANRKWVNGGFNA